LSASSAFWQVGGSIVTSKLRLVDEVLLALERAVRAAVQSVGSFSQLLR